MTPKSLFLIVLKILGLFLLKDFLWVLISTVSSIGGLGGGGSYTGLILLFDLFVLSLEGLLIVLLLFRTAAVAEKLKLDRGFEETRFSFDLPASQVLAIALVVVGALMVALALPDLCRLAVSYLHQQRFVLDSRKDILPPIAYDVVKILIGLLVIGERKRIARFLESKPSPEEPAGSPAPGAEEA